MQCKNCGEDMPVPEPRRTYRFDFGLGGCFAYLFSDVGILIILIVCAIGIPAATGLFSKDSELDAIKKALETPGIRVEVIKKGDEIDWKILKEEGAPTPPARDRSSP